MRLTLARGRRVLRRWEPDSGLPTLREQYTEPPLSRNVKGWEGEVHDIIGAPCEGAIPQLVRILPGNCRSSR